MAKLTDAERIRYSRQLLIPGWGEETQERLKDARVFIAGAGGLGSPVAIYLAAAGVGDLAICDADQIELSNLNRQVLHPDSRIGQEKAASAALTLGRLNSDIKITAHAELLDDASVARLVGQPHAVVDCLDNFETRYLLNRYCIEHSIPFVHGAVSGLIGQVTFISTPETPCLRCIFPQAPPKELFPVLGATPGIIGTIQAMETLKYLAGLGETLKGTLLIFEGEEMNFTPIKARRTPGCPDCGHL
jgi:molybdopterin/thiamine biosynthesis adenylyltransferase